MNGIEQAICKYFLGICVSHEKSLGSLELTKVLFKRLLPESRNLNSIQVGQIVRETKLKERNNSLLENII